MIPSHCRDTVTVEEDAQLARLATKRWDLKRRRNWLLSPIVRKLHPDVMSIVFELYLPDSLNVYNPYPYPLPSPLSLGAVCIYWREIAWSTPTLWSSLVLHVSKCDSQTAIVQEWLARSGQLPLSIHCRIRNYDYEPAMLELLDIINQYSTRWSVLDLCIPRGFYQYFHATAPILKSIRFQSNIEQYRTENVRLICPRLQRAHLLHYRLGDFDVQWDNLSHLNIEDMLIPDCILILRKTPRLVHLSFSGENHHLPSEETPVVTSLRSLRVRSDHTAHSLLYDILCPCLEELDLGVNYFSTPVEDTICNFIKSSACSLRSFAITYSSTSISFWGERMFKSMPSLRKLSITTPYDYYNPGNINISHVVAKVLFSQRGTRRFLPNLEILEYTGKLRLDPENYADLPPVDDVVQGPLQFITVDLYPAVRISANAVSFFLGLVERGLTVNVCSESQDILQSSIHYYSKDWVDDLDLSLMQGLC